MLLRLKRFYFVLLAPLSILLTSMAHRYPAATEKYFSKGLYKLLGEVYGRIFGYLPFSVTQFFIILLPVLAIIYIVYAVWRIIRQHETRKRSIVCLAANIACVVGVVWFMFTVCCGLNYARESFAQPSGLEVRQSSVEELTALCEELAERVNISAAAVTRDDRGQMVISAKSYYALAQTARTAYHKVAAEYPVLGGFCPLPKPVLYSSLMSRVDIVGIYIPFTMEANVNVDVCDYDIPSSMAHELAHFKGYMREDEANFIAYLACMASGDNDFIYSGEMLALVYVSNQLQKAGNTDYQRIMGTLSDVVWTDFTTNNEYWKQFEGPIAEFSTSVNDAYLKTNRQTDGIQSYGRMVDLLLADYRKRNS